MLEVLWIKVMLLLNVDAPCSHRAARSWNTLVMLLTWGLSFTRIHTCMPRAKTNPSIDTDQTYAGKRSRFIKGRQSALGESISRGVAPRQTCSRSTALGRIQLKSCRLHFEAIEDYSVAEKIIQKR